MSYHGDTMEAIVDRLEAASMSAGEDLAKRMQKHGEDLIRRNTPVETSRLRNSLVSTPIVYGQQARFRANVYAWTGEVFTEVEYAPYVEAGTGLWGPKRAKYKIEPKKPGGVLAFAPYNRVAGGGVIIDMHGEPSKSGLITVRYVMHPGSPGAHMFQIGTLMTEAEIDQWSEEPMRVWKNRVEGSMTTSRITRGSRVKV